MVDIGSLLFGRSKQRSSIGGIIVDVTETIVTTRDATATENPVESGSDITDHVRIGATSLRLEGFISNAPTDEMKSLVQSIGSGLISGIGSQLGSATKVAGLSAIGSSAGAVGGKYLGSQIGQGLGLFGSDRLDDDAYPQKTMMALLGLQSSGTPITIKTFFFPGAGEDHIYANMIITQLSFPQSSTEGDGLKFSLTAKHIDLVSLTLSGVSPDFIKTLQAKSSAPATKDLGVQTTKPAPEKPAAKVAETGNKSWATQIGGAIGNLGSLITGGQ